MAHCARCHRPLEILRSPVRRLWGTRYWWQGVKSLLAKPLRLCPACGAIHTWEGELLAAGAAETVDELRLKAYRSDMARLRDGYGGVVIAAELAVIWMSAGVAPFPVLAPILTIATGAAALLPFAFFSRKAREATSELKRLRDARMKGQLLP